MIPVAAGGLFVEVDMLEWFRALMPKEERFFDLYARHSAIVVQAAIELEAMLADGADVSMHGSRIIQFENQADDIARQVMPFARGSSRRSTGVTSPA